MKKRTTTKIILIVGLIGLLIWDVYAWKTENLSTISEVIRDAGGAWWGLVLAFGILLGHFFWPLDPDPTSEE